MKLGIVIREADFRVQKISKSLVFEFIFRGHIVDNMAYLPYTEYRKKIGHYDG